MIMHFHVSWDTQHNEPGWQIPSIERSVWSNITSAKLLFTCSRLLAYFCINIKLKYIASDREKKRWWKVIHAILVYCIVGVWTLYSIKFDWDIEFENPSVLSLWPASYVPCMHAYITVLLRYFINSLELCAYNGAADALITITPPHNGFKCHSQMPIHAVILSLSLHSHPIPMWNYVAVIQE